MGAISKRLNTPLETIKQYLQIDGDHDDGLVELLFQGAKEKADDFCNNPFTDKEGQELPIPAPIAVWCLNVAKREYERRANGLMSEQISGLGSVSWGDLDYTDLWPYRRNPGL